MRYPRRALAIVSLASVLFVAACNGSGGPTGTAGPTGALASDTPAATESVAPTSTQAAVDPGPWIADVCELYQGYFFSDLEIDEELPIPEGASLEEAQAAWFARIDRYGPLNDDWLADLQSLGPIAGAEPLYQALEDWNARRVESTANLRTAIEEATSLEELATVISAGGTTDFQDTWPIYVSIADISPDAIAALAAYEGQCNSMNVEAASIPTGRETAEFTQTAIEDDFEGEQVWSTEPRQGNEAVQADGAYRVTTTELLPQGGAYWVNTAEHDPATFGDVRIETTITREPAMFSGLVCRDDGAEDHTAYVMQVGGSQVYLWRKAPDFDFVGRRTLPGLGTTMELAMECVGGADGAPVTITVDIDGERVLEWVDEDPLAAEGFVGMTAGSVIVNSVVSYEEIRVLVP